MFLLYEIVEGESFSACSTNFGDFRDNAQRIICDRVIENIMQSLRHFPCVYKQYKCISVHWYDIEFHLRYHNNKYCLYSKCKKS